jgi:isoleucyl-tRNA synthetase
MFKPVKNNQNLTELELDKLEYWKKNSIFEKSLKNHEKAKRVVFFDGPPFANGLPHYGHLMISSLKDAVARYWTMKGFYVPRVAGWDCHGVPVENEIEKAHNIRGRADIEKIGIKQFNADCRASVFKYKKEWEQIMERMGRWVDFEHGYATLDNTYMESIWSVFKQIWDKGMVYQGYKPMHISTALETPLSNFEASLNYKDVTDYSVTAKFELLDQPGVYVLAWTTTPWTLPGNQALAIGKELAYVMVESEGQKYILGKDRLEATFKDRTYKLVKEVAAKDLLGKKYKPLFPYYQDADPNYFQIFDAGFVTTDNGTGVVHIAGGFGEDDYNLIKEKGLLPIIHVEMNGNFKNEVTDFAGKYVRGQDQNVGKYLKEKDLLFSDENFRHSYPHCWRTDTPLLNYVTNSWFVRVTDVKDKLLTNNQKINWQPAHIKDGRFGKWLEGARDWSISRSRYWGCPLPIWKNDNGEMICVGSIEELKKLTGGKMPLDDQGNLDLHKPFIDEITFQHPDHVDTKDEKFLMKRVPDVFDCWFESGSMPYAQLHYPFENKELFEENFPADFIIEAIDQTRGWFYTLHVLATILFDKPAFKNIICTGHINAADGEKLSKSKKNFPDPTLLFSTKGVDAVRFYLYQSPVVLGDGVRFSEQHVDEFLKKFNLTIWNTYSFFVTYANIDGWDSKKVVKNFKPKHALDCWILSELNALVKTASDEMDNYNVMKATRPMVEFIDSLSNWYVRRSRRRFWKSENDSDKNEAYQTLYTVLVVFSKMLAPFMPFMAEEIYRNLTGKESVHLENWPEFRKEFVDEALNEQNYLVRSIVTLGHQIRSKNKIKVRQPLGLVEIALPESADKTAVQKQTEVIAEELNVKEVKFLDLKDVGELVKKVLKPNAKLLGPKFGALVQDIIKEAKLGNFEENDGEVVMTKLTVGEGTQVRLTADEYVLETESSGIDSKTDAASEKGITVILTVEINDELLSEGYAREVVRVVQDLRKEADYNVSDHIILDVTADKPVADAVTKHADYIRRETLADELIQKGDQEWDKETNVEIDFHQVKVSVKKA